MRKTILKRLTAKMALLLTVLTVGFAAKANPQISADPIQLMPGETALVTVNLDTDQELGIFSYSVELPSGISMVLDESGEAAELLFSSDLQEEFTFNSNSFSSGKTWKFLLMSSDPTSIGLPNGSYPLMQFKVMAAQSLTPGASLNINFIDIQATPLGGGLLRQSNFSVPVSIVDAKVEISASVSNFVINPGNSNSVALALENEAKCNNLTFDLTLPEGLEYVGYEKTSRVAKGTTVNVKQNNGYYRIALTRMDLNEAITGTSGDFLILTFQATESLAETSSVVISNVLLSTPSSGEIDGTGCSFAVTNGKYAYDSAMNEVATLQAALDAAVAEIKNVCPDVAEEYDGSDIQTEIDNLQAAITTAYNNHTLANDYDSVMAPADEIAVKIANLLSDAKNAQEQYRKDSNQSAYNQDIAAINDLQAQLDAANKEIAEQYEGCGNETEAAAIQTEITNLKTAADAALAAVAESGVYVPVATETVVADLTKRIDTMLADAKAESQRRADNKAAYDKDIAAINDLQAQLDAANKEIAEQYEGCGNETEAAAIQTDITNLKTAADAALAAVAESGAYDSVATETVVADLTKRIDTMLAEAKAESQRRADNKAAYDADKTAIENLQARLDEIVAEIDTNFSEYKDQEAIDAATTALSDALEAVQAAYDKVAEEGTYTSPIDLEALNAQVEKVLTDAQDRKAEDDSEYKRQLDNERAYQAELDRIQELQDQLDAALKTIEEDYDNAGFSQEDADAIQKDIDNLKAAADAEFDSVAEEGSYEDTISDSEYEAISDAIDEMLEASKTEYTRLENNQNAYDADIETIDALRQELQDAIDKIKSEYPNYDYTEEAAAIEQALDDAEEAANQELEDSQEEGEYESVVDENAISQMIEEMLENAKTNGIGQLINDDDTEWYSLQGVRLAAPVQGQICIAVKNGKASKVFTK